MSSPSTQSPTAPEATLRRIRALLDQAESTPFPEEAEAFATKAAELMARHHVDSALVERGSGDPHRIVELDIDLGRGQYVRARLMLLGEVADALGCRLLSSSTPHGRVGHVIGHTGDTEQVSILYTSLLLQATRAVHHEVAPKGHGRIAFRRGFLMGFAKRVGERLRAQIAEAVRHTATANEAGTPSVALVLADRRHAVDAWIDGTYPRLARLAPASPVLGAAVAAGSLAGDRADLDGRSVPARRRSLSR